MIDWILNSSDKSHKVSGSYNFHLRCEPEKINTSSTITLTAFTNKDQKALVPCIYKWFTVRNGISFEQEQFKGNTFVCDPNDVGSIVLAQIISTDRQYSGIATFQTTPIKLELFMKKQIEHAISQRSLFSPVTIIDRGNQKQGQMKIFEDYICLIDEQSDSCFRFGYSIFEPIIQPLPRELTKLVFKFTQKSERELNQFKERILGHPLWASKSGASNPPNQLGTIIVSFRNRMSRDIFLLVLKAYYAKKQLKNSAVMQKLEQIDFSKDSNIDFAFQLQSLRSELVIFQQANQKLTAEKYRLFEQIHRLENEFEETLALYSKIVEDKCNRDELNKSISALTIKREQLQESKYRNAQLGNPNLNSRIRLLTEEVDRIRYERELNKQKAPTTPLHMSRVMKKDTNNLSRILYGLTQSGVQMDQNNQLRNQVNELVRQKINLEHQLQKSFAKIDDLEKSQYMQRNQKQKHNNTDILQSGNLKCSNVKLFNPYNSMIASMERQSLNAENNQLRKINANLLEGKNQLIAELSQLHTVKSQPQPIQSNPGSFKIVPTTAMGNEDTTEIVKLREALSDKRKKIEKLKSENNKLKQQVKQLQHAKQKIGELEAEIEVLNRGQSIHNRSQNISMEMDNYREGQLQSLKQQNQFLISDNDKLAKVCQRYMKDAQETNNLRQQILQLKKKMNSKLIAGLTE